MGYKKLGDYLFDIRLTWKFISITIIKLHSPKKSVLVIKKLKKENIYQSYDLLFHLAVGYTIFADMFAKGFLFSLAFNQKDLKEGEGFRGISKRFITERGYKEWQKIRKYQI